MLSYERFYFSEITGGHKIVYGRFKNCEKILKLCRLFRQGATTLANEMKIGETALDMNNRWRKVQNKSGTMPNLPMSVLYTEIQQTLLTRLRLSKIL